MVLLMLGLSFIIFLDEGEEKKVHMPNTPISHLNDSPCLLYKKQHSWAYMHKDTGWIANNMKVSWKQSAI